MSDEIIREMAQKLPELENELRGWESDRASLEARIATRRRLIQALRAEVGAPGAARLFEVSPPENGDRPAGRPGTGEAALRVLLDIGTPMYTREVFEAMNDRGWVPDVANPEAAVGSALWYLAKSGVVRKEKAGRKVMWAATDDSSPMRDDDAVVSDAGGDDG